MLPRARIRALRPLSLSGGAALAALYVAGRVLSVRCPLPPFAGLCALAVVLVPDTYEVLLNVVNLQWVLGVGLVLLLISGDPESRWQWTHDLAAAVALGLTGPFCILLAPLFAWRAWRRRSDASIVLAAIVVACALVQGYFVVTEPPAMIPPELGPGMSAILPAIGRRIGGSLLLGAFLGGETNPSIGTIAGIATLVGVGALALGPGRLRSATVELGLVFVMVLCSQLLQDCPPCARTLYFETHADSRYVYIPQLIAVWLLICAAAQKGRGWGLCSALLAWALIVNIPRLREPAYVDLHWSHYADRMRAGEAVTVPTNPPGWYSHLPARAH